jgi:alpha-glucan,water dikinase
MNGEIPRGIVGEAVQEILNCEVNSSSWTLMHRYFKCRDILKSGKLDILNRDHIAFVYIWLRYSFTKQLTWQKRYNTKPKELQHSQNCLTDEFCEQYKYACGKLKDQGGWTFLDSPDLIRYLMAFIGKGAGNG